MVIVPKTGSGIAGRSAARETLAASPRAKRAHK